MTEFSLKPEIIILDDDRDVGETLELILSKLGYQSVFFRFRRTRKTILRKRIEPDCFSRYSHAWYEWS